MSDAALGPIVNFALPTLQRYLDVYFNERNYKIGFCYPSTLIFDGIRGKKIFNEIVIWNFVINNLFFFDFTFSFDSLFGSSSRSRTDSEICWQATDVNDEYFSDVRLNMAASWSMFLHDKQSYPWTEWNWLLPRKCSDASWDQKRINLSYLWHSSCDNI